MCPETITYLSNRGEAMNDLFDISTLFSHGCYKGLFFDRQLQIWTKQNGRFRRLANQWSLPSGDYPFSISELRSRVSDSSAFKEFLRKALASLSEHASVEKKPAIKGKFVIAVLDDDGSLSSMMPEFPRKPRVIGSREEADIELLRYQKANPDTRFCLFECKGELKSIGVVLE